MPECIGKGASGHRLTTLEAGHRQPELIKAIIEGLDMGAQEIA